MLRDTSVRFNFQRIDGTNGERLTHAVPHNTVQFLYRSIDGGRFERMTHAASQSLTLYLTIHEPFSNFLLQLVVRAARSHR